jgi:hypothetical protein
MEPLVLVIVSSLLGVVAVTIVAGMVRRRNAPPAQFIQNRPDVEYAAPAPSTHPMVQSAREWAERGRKGSFCYADFNGADLGGVNLGPADENGRGADLSYATLRDADLSMAILKRANLRETDLQGACMEFANLSGACLKNANLQGANLEGANLQEADLRGANLQGARLGLANMQGALLKGARLAYADLLGAKLRNTDLRGIILEYATLERMEPVIDPATVQTGEFQRPTYSPA